MTYEFTTTYKGWSFKWRATYDVRTDRMSWLMVEGKLPQPFWFSTAQRVHAEIYRDAEAGAMRLLHHARAQAAQEAAVRQAQIDAAKQREEQQKQAREAEYARQEEMRYAEQLRWKGAKETFKKSLWLPMPLRKSAYGVVFGADAARRETVIHRVERLTHMLVTGVSGYGKSAFLHCLVSQLIDRSEVERLYLIDLKRGVEFAQYEGHAKVHQVWDFEEVAALVEELVEVMRARLDEMRQKRVRNYPGGRIVVCFDEFGEIENWPAVAEHEKKLKKQLLANLDRLSTASRAAGIVLVAALQKPTTDAMSSAFRNNLQSKICFRVAQKSTATALFGDDLEENPMTLPKGWCYFYDAMAGQLRYLKVPVAPEAKG